MQHDGWIELSDVEGMVSKDGSGKTINDAGKIKIKTCTKKVRHRRFASDTAVVHEQPNGLVHDLSVIMLEPCSLFFCHVGAGRNRCAVVVINSKCGCIVWGIQCFGGYSPCLSFTLCCFRVQHRSILDGWHGMATSRHVTSLPLPSHLAE